MPEEERQGVLFAPEYLRPTTRAKVELKPAPYPIWTEHKASLIAEYLRLFVYVTKHGTYIDGFAGPQDEGREDLWSAKLVLESEPRWLRHFHLCDRDHDKVHRLEALRDSQPPRRPKEPRRSIHIYLGDFNEIATTKLIAPRAIKEQDATFCLLDQRMFECHWQTVRAFAEYMKEGHKIELFYFLANSWLPRSFAGLHDERKATAWWGRGDWSTLPALKGWARAELLVSRFHTELGYTHVTAWPIRERRDGGHIMYFMVHASDHPEAPKLMRRAYGHVVGDEPEQLSIDFAR